MHPRTALISVLLLLACPLSCIAQDKGYWRAAGSTANSITGDISIADSKITIDFYVFSMVRARTLTTPEVAAAFDANVNAGGTGVLYRVTVPAAQRLVHKNTLCGTDETRWMATFVSGRTLQVAFFSASDPPTFTLDALRNSPDLCGTFTYAR